MQFLTNGGVTCHIGRWSHNFLKHATPQRNFYFCPFLSASAYATVINPGVTSCPNGTITFTGAGFTSSSWGVCGNATGTGPTATLVSTDITKDAPIGTLETFLKLSPGTLNQAFLHIPPAPGSAIGQSFSTATAGMISFDFVLTAEPLAPASTFFAINGSAFDLAFHTAAIAGSPTLNLAILPTHESFAAPAGTYTVGFGIVGQQPFFDPAVTFSNLAFTPNGPTVPEPGTLWLTVPVLALGLARRARRATCK